MQLKQLHVATVQRKEMLQDVAHALKQQFPAMRIEHPTTCQPVAADTFGTSGQGEHVGCWEQDTKSVLSHGSSAAARANPSASVLREIINTAAAAGSMLLLHCHVCVCQPPQSHLPTHFLATAWSPFNAHLC